MSAEKAGETFAERGEREAEVCAAFVAVCGVDAHEGIARGAKFGARLIVATATPEESACGISPTIKPLLPLIGNGQSASLRAAKGIPIIPELDCGLRKRDAGGFQGLFYKP